MAKDKRADLDAELAALEAELAALEAGTRKKPEKAEKPKKAKPAPAPAPEPTPAPATPEAPAEPEPAKKGRFALPSLKKGKKDPAPAEPVLAPEPAPAAAAPAPHPDPHPDPLPSYDLSLWRQDGTTWVRTVPGTPVRAIRRVLDENGELVREEAAARAEVERVDAVKAERGMGRLFRRKG